MDRSLPLLLIGLIFGGAIGFSLAASQGVTLNGHDHGTGGHAAHTSHDQSYNITGTAPTIGIDLRPDPATGWNLNIQTTDFKFAPQHASGENRPGEGHAHLYINETKIARIYGPWFHVPTLPNRPATVTVGLYTNDHRPLAVNGTPIRATLTIEDE